MRESNEHFRDFTDWLFRKQIEQYSDWKSYEIGFTGVGKTLLDERPTFPKPWLPGFIKKDIDAAAKIVADMRKETFRQTCIDVLGEDPDDWDSFY